MSTSPRLGYTELTSGQATPETTVNDIARYLEQGASKFIFKSKTTAAEPGSPADGDCYLLTASPTGTHWSGQANKIAFYENTAWVFLTAHEGYSAYVNDDDTFYCFDGTTWNTVGASAEATDSNMWVGTSTTTRVSPRRIATAAAPQTLTDGATISWDMSLGFNAKVTLGGNRTLTVSNPILGWTYCLGVIQDGTGSRTMTWPASFDWGTTGAPTLTTTASKRDRITLFCTDASTPKFDAFLSGKGFS
jgi:hypothetical protein